MRQSVQAAQAAPEPAEAAPEPAEAAPETAEAAPEPEILVPEPAEVAPEPEPLVPEPARAYRIRKRIQIPNYERVVVLDKGAHTESHRNWKVSENNWIEIELGKDTSIPPTNEFPDGVPIIIAINNRDLNKGVSRDGKLHVEKFRNKDKQYTVIFSEASLEQFARRRPGSKRAKATRCPPGPPPSKPSLKRQPCCSAPPCKTESNSIDSPQTESNSIDSPQTESDSTVRTVSNSVL